MSSKSKTSGAKEAAKLALVPKLRFPDFLQSPEWNSKPLVDVCSRITQGGTPDTTKPEYWGGAIRWITPAEMGKSDSPFIQESIRTITDHGLRDCASELLPVNSVILSVRAPIGHLAINTVPMAINQGCKGLIVSKALDSFFLYYSLLVAKPRLNDLGAGNTFKELGGAVLKNFAIPLPLVAEQQKIAECLSAVDEVIAAQARKLDALKTHKKGLMQQLFPREGETQPRLRFPEFRNAGEWQEAKLVSLSSGPLSNGVFNDPKKVGDGYKLINVSDMYIETTIDESRLALLALSPSDFKANQVSDGDVFFTRSSLVKSGIAVSNIFVGASNDVTYDGHLIRFRPNKNKVIPLFCHYLFKTAPIRAQLVARGKTATMTTIGQEDVASVMLFYPGKDEQRRIAECLSSLDALITAETHSREALRSHKRALMQQLFPSPDSAHS